MHHAHACDCKDQSPPRTNDSLNGQHIAGHTDHSHHERQECHGVKCSFVRTTDDTVAKSLDRIFKARAAFFISEDFTLPGVSFDGHFFCANLIQPPVNHYPVNQVLLI
jgi:hypothetical protein